MPWKERKTAQGSIPFECIYDDGIIYLGDSHYSVTFEFSDINYNNTSENNRISIFEMYCYFINAFDDNVKLQVHIENRPLSNENLKLELDEKVVVETNNLVHKDISECIGNYNSQMYKRITGSNSFIQKKYITLTVCEKNIDLARKRFNSIDNDILGELRKLKCTTKQLDDVQRLYLLRNVYRPDDLSVITVKNQVKTGIYGKDLIAPYYADLTNEKYIKLGDYYTKTLFITDFPEELSDKIISDITSIDENILLTMNILPQNPAVAISSTEKKLKKLDEERYNSHIKQSKLGVTYPETPRNTQRAITSAEDYLTDLKSRNEKMFLANFLIMVKAKNIEDLESIIDNIHAKIIKTGCTLQPFTFAHEDGFNSCLPLGRNDTFVKRTFTTSSIAVFTPFNVVEIVERGGFCYGKNKLSNNILLLNRKKLTNPHGFFFGTSGSGKSMGAKSEIWECFFRTNDDMIIIDPDGEFAPIVQLLGGQVIDISGTADTTFNAFDISEYYSGDDKYSPVPFKSEFIISLLEVTLNYRDGLDTVTKSVIDRCVREIYNPYLKSKKDSDIPTFSEFFDSLNKQDEPEAKYLASALEIYVHGSLNIFSKQTNVNLNNRLICFNTKKLGSQLKTMGMTIVQDYCWNLITKNQKSNTTTWLWNDEVHLSLKNSVTANWLIEMWKRGRKYGLIATGMTQEIRDVCRNESAKSLISNSEFVVLYRHKEDVVPDIGSVMNLTHSQISRLLTCEAGTGLFKAGNSIVEFDNTFDRDTLLFNIMKTNVGKD